MLPFARSHGNNNMKKATERKISQLECKLERVRDGLLELGPMRPGTITRQYRDPAQKKRAFYQLSYTHKGRGRSEYVRPENLVNLRKEVASYKRFRKLIETWVELSLEVSQLRIKATVESP